MRRRRFLQTSIAGVTSLAAARALGVDPPKRIKPSLLRASLAAYSMRSYLDAPPDAPQHMNLFDFVDFCHTQGLTGTELTSYYFPKGFDKSYLKKLKRHCQLRGISISGGAIRNDFCTLDTAKLEADIAHTKRWIDTYAFLGAPAIRIFAGKANKGEELSKTLSRCARNCQLVADYAADKGVMLALENHGGVTATAEGLLSIVTQVDSPGLGINFDSGNFKSTSDPYRELAMIAPYAINAQIKVKIWNGSAMVASDLQRIVTILREAQYSGWVALEYEEKESPKQAIPVWLKRLKPLLDG